MRESCNFNEYKPNTAGGNLLPRVLFASCLLVCASSPALSSESATQKYPDVLKATVQARAAGVFDFDVTVSSPYDTPQRYADAFRAMGKAGEVYGERILGHDHAAEQPFTRDLYNVAIPREVKFVVIQARDKTYGYGGKTVAVMLPGR